jgi:hypothetical protein
VARAEAVALGRALASVKSGVEATAMRAEAAAWVELERVGAAARALACGRSRAEPRRPT